MARQLMLVITLFIAALAGGCGGGGGSSATGNASPVATTAVVSFSLVSSSRLPFRISTVEVSATLPPGVSVATNGSQISSGLAAGSALGGAATSRFPIFGRYSAPNRITVVVADSSNDQSGFGPGEIVRLTCNVAAGATFGPQEELSLRNSLSFRALGYDPTAATNPTSLDMVVNGVPLLAPVLGFF